MVAHPLYVFSRRDIWLFASRRLFKSLGAQCCLNQKLNIPVKGRRVAGAKLAQGQGNDGVIHLDRLLVCHRADM